MATWVQLTGKPARWTKSSQKQPSKTPNKAPKSMPEPTQDRTERLASSRAYFRPIRPPTADHSIVAMMTVTTPPKSPEHLLAIKSKLRFTFSDSQNLGFYL